MKRGRANSLSLLDTALLASIVLVILLIGCLSIERVLSVKAVALVTPVTLFPAPTSTMTPAPPLTRTPTRTASPRPTQTKLLLPSATHTPRPPSPSWTPTIETAELEPRQVFFPSVTPRSAVTINGTSIPTPVPTIQLPRGSVTIMLLGSDKRPGRGDYRTDTIILANIVPQIPAVTLLSIPRDLYVYIPGYQFHKINVADEQGELMHFPNGGAGLLKQTIEYNLGIHVDYYARVDFAGFMKVVDTLGGIDVVANCPLEDVFPDDPITESPAVTGTLSIEKPGVVHLDGKHALWYARSRETTSDWDRSLRQQRVLRAMWNKITDQGLVTHLPELWIDLTTTTRTDLKLNDLLWLATIGARLDAAHVQGHLLDGNLIYSWTTPDTGMWVISPLPDKVGPALQEMFNPPTNMAAQAPARIEVLNGTTNPDWGILAADRLQWEGYWVANIAQADRTDYARTRLIDLTTTPKGSRRQVLADLLRIAPGNLFVQPDASNAVQYRVIVGSDFQPCVRPGPAGNSAPTPAPTAATS